MNKAHLLTLARYMGIAAAGFVPALVVAQSLPNPGNLQAGRVVLADDILRMRTAIEQLQGAAIPKSRIYQVPAVVAAPAPGVPEISASCRSPNDLMLHCGCRGISSATDPNPLAPASNNTVMDLRRVLILNPTTTPTCSCQAQNQGTNADAGLVAVATCVPLGVQ